MEPKELTLNQKSILVTNICKVLGKNPLLYGEEATKKADKILELGDYDYFYALFFNKKYNELRNHLNTL